MQAMEFAVHPSVRSDLQASLFLKRFDDLGCGQWSRRAKGNLPSLNDGKFSIRPRAANVGIVANSGLSLALDQSNPERNEHGDFNTMPPKSPTMLGPLSLGLCGNALIMRVGADARCFHHQSLPSEMSNFREHASCGKVLYAPPHTDSSCCAMSGRYSTIENQDVSLIKSNPVTTKRYGQTQQKKVGKTVISARNLFERSSFHFFELLFHYPFLTSNSVDLKIEIPSRRSLKDLANVLSQTAAGLAGVSVTWLLFALSRILWLDIPLNKHDITTLAMGFGFVSLSWAMKRVSDVFMRLADHNRLKSSNKKYILNLQKELQYITFSAILLVVVCFMGGS